MKYIDYGTQISTANDNVNILDKVPCGVYVIEFSKLQGFYLLKTDDSILCRKDKIYGRSNEYIERVIKTYFDDKFNRNLGALFIGDKGMGKSMCALEICRKLYEEHSIPVVIVNTSMVGIDDFMSKLHGNIVFLFDEFDKVFACQDGEYCQGDNEIMQENLLSMLDGTTTNTADKKLFLATCNKIVNISKYLINRPGRFHYNFRYFNLTCDEISEYLLDNIEDEPARDEVKRHINFLGNFGLSYDCLKAISYELNSGSTLKEALTYLNIICLGDAEKFEFRVKCVDGTVMEKTDYVNSGLSTVFNIHDSEHTKAVDIYLDNLLVDVDPQTNKVNRSHKISYYELDGVRNIPENISNSWDYIEYITVRRVINDFSYKL